MNSEKLITIAKSMVQSGKGILAADESNPTCTKRLEGIGVESTFDKRNEYRDMLFTTSGLEKYISGVILYDETLRQSTTCEKHIPFPEYLTSKEILPGIKVDTGAKTLAGFNNGPKRLNIVLVPNSFLTGATYFIAVWKSCANIKQKFFLYSKFSIFLWSILIFIFKFS